MEKTIDTIMGTNEEKDKESSGNEKETEKEIIGKKIIFAQHRGNITDDYCQALKKWNALCNPIMTLHKLKTLLP